MLHLVNESDSFKTVLDRNGSKIHIGEQVLILNCGYFIRCQVVAFSNNYKYVYMISGETLYKRRPENIIIVRNLQNLKNRY